MQQAEQAKVVESGSLIDQIMQETRLKPADEGYETAKKGIQAFITDLLAPQRKGEKVEQKVADAKILGERKRNIYPGTTFVLA